MWGRKQRAASPSKILPDTALTDTGASASAQSITSLIDSSSASHGGESSNLAAAPNIPAAQEQAAPPDGPLLTDPGGAAAISYGNTGTASGAGALPVPSLAPQPSAPGVAVALNEDIVKPVATPAVVVATSPSATAPKPKHGLPDEFRLRMPAGVAAHGAQMAAGAPHDPLGRKCRIFCSATGSWLARVLLFVRLLLALPIGAVLCVALGLIMLLLLVQLVWLLPLALLLGFLLPHEQGVAITPMVLPGKHIVVLGGGGGLSRAVALECVRQGADVTVLASESEALTSTYELMKKTSLERQAHVKQQLRCSPLELTDGPMACFVALQNVLELVGKIDCFICHPAELILEGRGASGGEATRLSQDDLTEIVLCCVWAVRAVMFPMQRQTNGRILIAGSAPSGVSLSERVSFKLAMQSLIRSLRSEFRDFGIPVSLAAPLGSQDPVTDPANASQAAFEKPTGCLHGFAGVGRPHSSLVDYARHVVSGMVAGAPYILSPGGGGVLPLGSSEGGGMMSGLFGYGDFSPAMLVLQTVLMPVLALADAGLPMLWREVLTGWWHWWSTPSEETATAYGRLRDDALSA